MCFVLGQVTILLDTFLALLFSHLKHTTSKQKEESITFNSSHI